MVLSLSLGACGDDVGDVEASKMIDGHNENPNEVITSLRLTFSPLTGEETFSVSWSDPRSQPDSRRRRYRPPIRPDLPCRA